VPVFAAMTPRDERMFVWPESFSGDGAPLEKIPSASEVSAQA